MMMVQDSVQLRALANDVFGINAQKEREYQGWLVRARPVFGKQRTNGLALLDELVQYIERLEHILER